MKEAAAAATATAAAPSPQTGATSRRCSSRNRRAAKVGFAALVALGRRTAEASVPNLAYGEYTGKGCYRDEKRPRAMEYMSNIAHATMDTCAAACIGMGYPFMGLEYGHECFCGNEDYDKHGLVDLSDPDNDRFCDMTLEDDGSPAGGWWAISVYDIQVANVEDLEMNSANVEAEGTGSDHQEEGTGAGGATDVVEDGKGAVESGKRAFTVVNKCSQTIRVGSTGGRITFGTGTNGADKSLCDAWGPSAVYNPGPMGIGCFWDFPPEESGNTDRMLEPGKSFRYNLYETESDVRWSGTIWGSTGCDKMNGCLTGVCNTPDSDYICPAYVGPGGPTTKAEFTLSDGYKDYYDISNIDGSNLPMMIEPDDPVFPSAEVLDDPNENIKKYECGSPGAPTPHHESLSGCSWSYENTVPTYDGEDMSQYLRLVHPESYDDPIKCTSDADCGDLICGVHPQRWANGDYKGGVEQGSCGEHIAWVSAGGACAGGWISGEFPDAFPFHCGAEVAYGMRANMYGCYGTTYGHSGYTPGADDTACGCPDWESAPYNLKAPSISECVGKNPEWATHAMPWAGHQKKACPTAYTFPYDDQTSTFTCFDGEGPAADDHVNTQSYTITFCPGDTEKNMFG